MHIAQPEEDSAELNEDEKQKAMLLEEDLAIWGIDENGRIKKPPFVSGIALSGGGIRAAIVALGVLQVLAEKKLLTRFSYLSTVSGGGYIGSALTWFWSNERASQEGGTKSGRSVFGCSETDFPFQSRRAPGPPIDQGHTYAGLSVKEMAQKNLTFLQNHGSYLTTGDGIGFAGLVIAVLRTVLVSIAVWVPLLIMFFLVLERFDYEIVSRACPKNAVGAPWCDYIIAERPIFTGILMLACLLFSIFALTVIVLAPINPGAREELALTGIRKALLGLLSFVVCPLVSIWAIVYLASKSYVQPEVGALLGVVLFGCACCVVAGLSRFSGPNPSYRLRRFFEKKSSRTVPFSLLLLFLGALPILVPADDLAALGWLGNVIPNSLAGVVSLLSGVATALYGYYLKAKSIHPGAAGQFLAIVGSLLFIAGLLLFSFTSAHEAFNTSENYVIIVLIWSFFIACWVGGFSSVNATGLHRFYRDRLMETFMPSENAIRLGLAAESKIADTLSIMDMWDAGDAGRRPYHLINTHAILVKDKETKVSVRGGDNFVISAAIVGSRSTGWMRTKEYIARNGPLTLATAMAASGAAANAYAGYIGTGPTRERFISAVMAILNIRLGIWVRNPNVLATLANSKPSVTATYFSPVFLSGILGQGYNRDSKFLELSDGGHFENLGLYELVRRKVKLALVVDAEQDETISLSSLVSSVNRVKDDFGAQISFEEGFGPEMLIGQESKQFPSGVHIAQSPFIVGEIQYADRTFGTIIYIKSTMVSGLDFTTDGYRASHPDFPHQSTIDQFFDPDQFEAYRDLGRKSCTEAVEKLDLGKNFTNRNAIKKRFADFSQP